MRSSLLAAATAAVTAASALAFGPAPVTPDSAPDCANTIGRELLTAEGLSLDVASPAVTAPELAATAEVTGEAITPHRSAHWYFTVDAAPYEQVKLTATITWDDADNTPSDLDLYGYTYFEDTDFKTSLGTSNAANIEGGDTRVETFTATVDDCQRVDIEMRAWAAQPAQDVSFELTLEPVGDPDDTVLARPADQRVGLYLGGDRPGNAGAVSDYAGAEEYPFAAALVEPRPTANNPNTSTHALAGFQAERNPLQTWWGTQLDTLPQVTGNPTALLWLSAPTQPEEPTSLDVQLFLNGAEQVVTIPGSELTADVRPFLIEFEPVDAQVYAVTLQVSTTPMVATSGSTSDKLGDATHTVWFDSVQYQSRLYLPTSAG